MKKIRLTSLILCLIILSCVLATPSRATEPTDADTTVGSYEDYSEDLSVTYGCHSADAQMPLCGSNKLLKTAGAAFLYETNSDTLMYAWNPDAPMYPASLVKIMTALLALEKGQPTDEITVTANALAALPENSSTTDLQAGEVVTLEQLLYCLMVGSSNDAAVVIAEHIAGSQQGFLAMMNQRAAELGCTGTNFINPHGLHDDAQVTTARDMAKILAEAAKNEQFMVYFATTVYSMPATNLSEERRMSSTNYTMMSDKPSYYDSRVTGGRTGITTDRDRCLAVTANKNGLSYVAVVLGAVPTFEEDGYTVKRFGSYEETRELLDLGFNGYAVTQILSSNQVMAQYAVTNGENSISATPASSVSAVLPADITFSDLSIRYQQAIGTLTAPVKAGEKLTSVQVWYGNVCVAQSPIIAMNASGLHRSNTQNPSGNEGKNGLITALIVIGIVLAVIISIAGILYIVQLTRKTVIRAQHRRRRRDRRRSR